MRCYFYAFVDSLYGVTYMVQWMRTSSTAHVNTLDDDGSSQQKRRGNNKDRSGPRRTWTLVEEEALINGLKSLVSSGWKCDNGFRNGYLAQLEAHLKRAFPQCDLKAEPHINSKLHVWKRQYSTLCSMMAKSVLGGTTAETWLRLRTTVRGMNS
ncbi:UNVERIFIED_CONTAM: hypothetical protein Sradi_7059100 [Sesamum radiatum]|uniref:Myb/SANT-like domain-containing protein n=1 Tax=Sesamum radiatum TaxID=300843 RepID=A0AAW2J7T1_SESRA